MSVFIRGRDMSVFIFKRIPVSIVAYQALAL